MTPVTTLRAAYIGRWALALLALFVGCRSDETQELMVTRTLSGTWSHGHDGLGADRQELIIRHADGRLELRSMLGSRVSAACEGRWKVTDGGNVYQFTLPSAACLPGLAASQPSAGDARLRIVSVIEQEAVFADPGTTGARRIERRVAP